MKKWILLSILSLVLISGGVAFYILSLPPKEKLSKEFKEKAVGDLLGRKAQLEAVEEKKGNTLYSGKNITFSYPARAIEYKYRETSGLSNDSRLEDFIFDIKVPRLRFNLLVLKNTSNLTSVTDYPSVRLRRDRAYEYKEEEIMVGGHRGYSYYKSGQEAEKSSFVLANGKIYTLLVSGNSDEEVAKLFDDIISSAEIR